MVGGKDSEVNGVDEGDRDSSVVGETLRKTHSGDVISPGKSRVKTLRIMFTMSMRNRGTSGLHNMDITMEATTCMWYKAMRKSARSLRRDLRVAACAF